MNRETLRQQIKDLSIDLNHFYNEYKDEINDFCENNISDFFEFQGFVYLKNESIGIVYTNTNYEDSIYIF